MINSLSPVVQRTMGVRTVFTRLLSRGGPTLVVECRHCGRNVSLKVEECPDCGATEFSRYEIPG